MDYEIIRASGNARNGTVRDARMLTSRAAGMEEDIMGRSTMTPEPVVLIELDVFDRLAILAACAAFLLFVIIVVICKVSPSCWLHMHCPLRAKYDDQEPEEEKFRKQEMQLMPVLTYGSTSDEASSAKLKSSKKDKLKSIRESTGPDTSSEDFIELPRKRGDYKVDGAEASSPYSSETSRPGSPIGPVDGSSPFRGGCLDFSLKYDSQEGKLHIRILRVRDLLEKHGAADQYVKVKLFLKSRSLTIREKLSREKPKSDLQVEKRTRIQKDTTELTFNETFPVDILEEELKFYTLNLQLCDFDKYSRHLVAGETSLTLNSVNLAEIGEISLSQDLRVPAKEKLGEIYLCLSYLLTAEKLTVTVMRAKGLRKMDKNNETTDSLVKVALMYEGRQLKKVKTQVHRDDLDPTYSEAFVFDVPKDQLDMVYVMVAVMHNSSEKLQPVKNMLIGRVYLGKNFEGTELAHWMEMVQRPRKQVACWHQLR